ncbi:MAG: SpoIIE family protein phosphatase [Clostridiales bacterium]|nr:SpoIIE family protein phosphatase [Clostridiales bacterium]
MKKPSESVVFKSVTGILLMLIVFTFIVSLFGYRGFTDALLTEYAEGAFRTAETARYVLDPNRMDSYAESGGTTEEYMKAWDSMDRLCNSFGATFIYVIQPDLTDYAHITFIFSTINHNSTYTHYDFGYVRETTNDDYKTKYRLLYEQKSERELVIRDKGYIETDPHITAMISLKDSTGQVRGILCVQRQMDGMAKARRSYVKRVILTMIVLALIVTAIQSVYLNHVLLSPLKKISEEAGRFASENVTAKEKLKDRIKNRDEVGQLAESIDRMEEQIVSYVSDLTTITAEKERISTELDLATRIQDDMLPNSFPAFPERNDFDIYANMDPAREVGGDFYDFFLIDEDHFCMLIADVSGKGIPAALFMMAAKIILSNNALSGKSPAEILEQTNSVICKSNREEMFVTVWIGILEISTGKLKAANAGHEYPAVRHADGMYEMFHDPHGLVIGGMEESRYKEYELTLEPGSNLFLYTDGVTEAADRDGNRFGEDMLLRALNAEPDGTPEEILGTVRKAVDEFVKDAEQFDDLTMLCMKYSGLAGANRQKKKKA